MVRRLLPLLVVPLVFGCIDSTAPKTTPSATTSATPSTDSLPPIPRPSSLTDFGPSTSEVQTEIRPLEGDFDPQIDTVTADWAIEAVRWGGTLGSGLSLTPTVGCAAMVFEGTAASDRLANSVSQSCPESDVNFGFPTVGTVSAGTPLLPDPDSLPRRLIWLDGAATPASLGTFTRLLQRLGTCTTFGACWQTDVVTYTLRWPQATKPVYVRRDRWWERRPLLGDGSQGLILEGPVTRTVSFTYSSGSTTTNTQEFARSITAEAGLSYGAFSASVSATLSQTFTTSVEVRRDTTVSVTEELSGEAGVARVMTFWVLMQRYTITDADGNPYEDDNYRIPTYQLSDPGEITALVATDFPLTGGTP